MRQLMQQTSRQGTPQAVNDRQRRPVPFLYSHHMGRGFRRLVVWLLLATLVGLLVTVLLIPGALG